MALFNDEAFAQIRGQMTLDADMGMKRCDFCGTTSDAVEPWRDEDPASGHACADEDACRERFDRLNSEGQVRTT